jgi:hypothetical protein
MIGLSSSVYELCIQIIEAIKWQVHQGKYEYRSRTTGKTEASPLAGY